MSRKLFMKTHDWTSGRTKNEEITQDERNIANRVYFKDLTAGMLCTDSVPTVMFKDELKDVLSKINQSEYRLVVVINSDNEVIGTIGRSDINNSVNSCSGSYNGECGIRSHKAEDVMNLFQKFAYVCSSDTIITVIEKMNDALWNTVLVLEKKNGRKIVKGALTRRTIINNLVDEFDSIERKITENDPIIQEIKRRSKECENLPFCEEVFAKLENIPSDVQFSNDFINKISYNQDESLLVFKGVMSKEEKEKLLTLSQDKLYKDAVEILFRKSKENTPEGMIEEIIEGTEKGISMRQTWESILLGIADARNSKKGETCA